MFNFDCREFVIWRNKSDKFQYKFELSNILNFFHLLQHWLRCSARKAPWNCQLRNWNRANRAQCVLPRWGNREDRSRASLTLCRSIKETSIHKISLENWTVLCIGRDLIGAAVWRCLLWLRLKMHQHSGPGYDSLLLLLFGFKGFCQEFSPISDLLPALWMAWYCLLLRITKSQIPNSSELEPFGLKSISGWLKTKKSNEKKQLVAWVAFIIISCL